MSPARVTSPRCARSCRSTARSSSPAGGSGTGNGSPRPTRSRRTAPGFGECVGNDGDVLETGSYQFIATDTDGDESAPGGFVVGAERIDQRFSNNGSDPICGVRIAPSTSRYFEAYVFDAEPVPPGAVFTLPVAVVEQDVETMSCRKGEVLSTFDFLPDAGEVQQLRP